MPEVYPPAAGEPPEEAVPDEPHVETLDVDTPPPDVEDAPPVDETDEEDSGSDTSDDGTETEPPEAGPDPDPGEGG